MVRSAAHVMGSSVDCAEWCSNEDARGAPVHLMPTDVNHELWHNSREGHLIDRPYSNACGAYTIRQSFDLYELVCRVLARHP